MPSSPAQAHITRLLEHLRALNESGQLLAIAVATVEAGGAVGRTMAGHGVPLAHIVGATAALHGDMLDRLRTPAGPLQ
jgi:hypothetical protein